MSSDLVDDLTNCASRIPSEWAADVVYRVQTANMCDQDLQESYEERQKKRAVNSTFELDPIRYL